MKLPIRTLLLATLAALTLLACGKQAAPSAASATASGAIQQAATEVVRIGHVGPLTGSIAHLGKDNENGARLAIEEANARGV